MKIKQIKAKPKALAKTKRINPSKVLYNDIRQLIEESKEYIANTANSSLAYLHWRIGKRINVDVLKNKRAIYVKRIVVSAIRQLEKQYGRGFDEKNIRRMMQFATVFPDEKIGSDRFKVR
jgi:hypothetical protein